MSDTRVDLARGVVSGRDGDVRLTTTELALLTYLVSNPSRTISRDELHHKVWGFSPNVVSRACDVTMRRLRIKVETTPKEPKHLITVHGEGYRYEPLLDHVSSAQTGARSRPLPIPAIGVVGRDKLLDPLVSACKPGTLHTLVGPAGVGKTTVAVELAHRLNLAWFGDLRSATDVATLCSAIARCLGQVLGSGDPVGAVAQLLGAQPAATLILDEFEHLLAHRDLVTHWRQASPDLCVVVTSRAPLAIAGERRWAVEPLSTDGAQSPAAAAYMAAVRQVMPGVTHPIDDVSNLVRRLDGLPLALALAASRVQVLPPAALLARLDAHPRVLRDPTRNNRHGSLELAFEASWDLLSPTEQQALAQCSVFRGGFTLAAAEQVIVVGPDEEAVDAVQALVEHSLLTTHIDSEGALRFDLLSVVREFAAPRDARPEETARRHFAHYSSTGPETLPPHADEKRVRSNMARELANLQAAVENALAQGDEEAACNSYGQIWLVLSAANRGPYLTNLGERLLPLITTPTRQLRHRTRLADSYFRSANWAKAEEHEQIAIRLMPADLEASERSTVHLVSSFVCRGAGRSLDERIRTLRLALECANESGSSTAGTRIEARLAQVRLQRGDDGALADLDQVVQALNAAGLHQAGAHAMLVAVPPICRLGLLDHAMAVIDANVPIVNVAHRESDLLYARSTRAFIQALRGDWSGAAEALDTLIAAQPDDTTPSPFLRAVYLHRSSIAMWLDDPDTALRCIDIELADAMRAQDRARVARAHLYKADSFAQVGDRRRAERALAACDSKWTAPTTWRPISTAIPATRALVLTRLQRWEHATKALDLCKIHAEEVPEYGHEIYLIARAIIADAAGDLDAARRWIQPIRGPFELISVLEYRRLKTIVTP